MKKDKIYIDALPILSKHMSGVGHNALELIKALDRLSETANIQIYLVVPLCKKNGLKTRHLSNNIKVKVIPLPARVFDLLLRLRLMPPLDMLLGKGSYLFLNYRNWPLLNSRSYTYIHDATYMRYPEFVQPKNLAYLRKYMKQWIKRADKILTLSTFSMKELIHYFDLSNSKIAIIYCGVDQSVFYPRNDKQIEVVKQKYSIPNRPYVLYLGNIEPRKNLKRLVKAFDDLKVGIKNKYALVIIGGDGWLNEDTYDEIDRARKNGSVIYKPNRYVSDEDIPALISGASLLAHPALYEGFGLSPLQAMSCGIPVVVGNNSSFPEVVGSAGLFVDVEDESDISAKMEAALTDGSLHKTLSKKGLLQAKKFTWERSAQAIITCLKEA